MSAVDYETKIMKLGTNILWFNVIYMANFCYNRTYLIYDNKIMKTSMIVARDKNIVQHNNCQIIHYLILLWLIIVFHHSLLH